MSSFWAQKASSTAQPTVGLLQMTVDWHQWVSRDCCLAWERGGCLAGLGTLGFNRQWSVKVEKEKGVRKCVVLSSHFPVQGYS